RPLRQPIALNAPTSDLPATVGVDHPFNPYGSWYYSPTGAANPDGTPRLAGTPRPVTLLGLAFVENGAEEIDVTSGVYRGVAGVRGSLFDRWAWETAALYTRAYTSDVSPARDSRIAAARGPAANRSHRVQPVWIHLPGGGFSGGRGPAV